MGPSNETSGSAPPAGSASVDPPSNQQAEAGDPDRREQRRPLERQRRRMLEQGPAHKTVEPVAEGKPQPKEVLRNPDPPGPHGEDGQDDQRRRHGRDRLVRLAGGGRARRAEERQRNLPHGVESRQQRRHGQSREDDQLTGAEGVRPESHPSTRTRP